MTTKHEKLAQKQQELEKELEKHTNDLGQLQAQMNAINVARNAAHSKIFQIKSEIRKLERADSIQMGDIDSGDTSHRDLAKFAFSNEPIITYTNDIGEQNDIYYDSNTNLLFKMSDEDNELYFEIFYWDGASLSIYERWDDTWEEVSQHSSRSTDVERIRKYAKNLKANLEIEKAIAGDNK